MKGSLAVDAFPAPLRRTAYYQAGLIGIQAGHWLLGKEKESGVTLAISFQVFYFERRWQGREGIDVTFSFTPAFSVRKKPSQPPAASLSTSTPNYFNSRRIKRKKLVMNSSELLSFPATSSALRLTHIELA